MELGDLLKIEPSELSPDEQRTLLALLEEVDRRQQIGGHLQRYFPDEGEFQYGEYPKHLDFFAAGAGKRERLFMAANRVGKTVAGGYEAACHATGLYPHWWTGRRFDKPTDGWAAGDTGETTKDILQKELFGEHLGEGLIARELIGKTTSRQGISGAIKEAFVRHVSGGWSKVGFKSFDQGRRAYQGTAKDWIWLDEECPEDVYNECLVRTMTTGGVQYVTFTPLQGMTMFVSSFLKAAGSDGPESDTKSVVMAGWDDVPHLGETEKREILLSTPEFLRDSRSKGIPGLGAGAIYPFPDNEILVDPMPLRPDWRRFYGLDVGWNYTAAVFCAHDRDRDIVYVYDVYKRSAKEPDVHASAIKRRNLPGLTLTGAIDPGARQRAQRDGARLIQLYRGAGLKVVPADNAVTAGIDTVLDRYATGRLKVFRGLTPFMDEHRMYRRDEKGRIVKENDHIMDALRYALMTGIRYGKPAYRRRHKGAEGKRYY